MHQSVQATITKCYRLGGLNNKNSISLEAGKSMIKVPANSVYCEGSLPGSQMVAILLCPHLGEGGGRKREKGRGKALALRYLFL